MGEGWPWTAIGAALEFSRESSKNGGANSTYIL
jgi:hypothetical protein